MYITGTGITPFTAKLKPDFKPITELALEWKKTANGVYTAVDRGASADTYSAEVRLYGTEAVIDTFIEEIEANRDAGNNTINLTQFNATEHIFGANVNHSIAIIATVLTISKKAQGSWKGFSIIVTLRATSVSFTGASASLPLSNLDIGFEADSTITINKVDSYDSTFTYQEHDSDIGIFTGSFVLEDSDMAEFRNILRITRNDTIRITAIVGVSSLFGKRRGDYPHDVNIIEWEDLGMIDVGRWRIKIVFAENLFTTITGGMLAFPIMTASGAGILDHVGSGALELPGPTLLCYAKNHGSGNLTLPINTLSGAGTKTT